MRSLPPLAAVRVFEAAARHGNFTRAAAELGMTQAAVSHQVRLLEDRVGGPLFARSARGAVLTPLGAQLAPAATAALDQLARAFAQARGDRASELAISAVTSFGTLWLAPRLGGFMAAHPSLSVRLDIDMALVDFTQGQFDLAIRSGLGPWPGLRADLLFHWHASPMASPDFLARHGPVHEPRDLLALPHAASVHGWWQAWFAEAGIALDDVTRPRSGLVLEAQTLEGQAALAGQGMAMLTRAFWRRELAEGRLVEPFPRCVRFEGAYWLVYPEGAARSGKLRAFRDWILAEAAPERADGPGAAG